MKLKERDFPLHVKIGFNKLFDGYRAKLNSSSELIRSRAKAVLDIATKYPILTEGLTTDAQLKKYKKQIDLITEDLFSSVLQENEIKIATIPFQELIFRSTQRYKNIITNAGESFELEIINFDDSNFFLMGCSIILNNYYGYKTDFRRPFYYKIPDKNGILRSYRILFNGDFIEIEKTDRSLEITETDYLELLENYDNVDVWKKKFPPDSWNFKGFIIANMYDATVDVSLTDFKAGLLDDGNSRKETFIHDFRKIIESVYNLPDLKVGYTVFNSEEDLFEQLSGKSDVSSYILNGKDRESTKSALCSVSHSTLLEEYKFYCISDIDHYHELYPKNVLYKKLADQNIKSAIIAALVSEGKVLGILEIVSPHKQELNTINASKLLDIIPYLIDSIKRKNKRQEDEIELLIQNECTSIHSSVEWKFRKEAKRVLEAKVHQEEASFREIVFENVYPLFGQIDIKGSSHVRNIATKNDLILQLHHVKKIIDKIYKIEALPIYEQINFSIDNFLKDITDHLQVDGERRVLSFLQNEIVPLYDHLSSKNDKLKSLISEYYKLLDRDKGFIYKHRKDYDESVMLINKTMAGILDEKQEDAQNMYPHYYERFKTDGVEHNLYIGESITKEDGFNKIYLYNLRLWQLQAMCEMENSFYQLKDKLLVPLDVTSMILAFNSSLALRFRMDEKRFDVDGTYNARYEVVKKRVDKAHVKGTDERITQPGKITIVYSQKTDEIEYLKYVNFLQSKKHLGDEVEILELEDLQGVTGLKAIRVNVLYNRGEKDKAYYTYEDLMKEITN